MPRVRGLARVCQIGYHTRTRGTRLSGTAGLPVPVLNAKHFQRRSYNKGRLSTEFQEGDVVLLNPHSLSLLRNETGHGRKLLMKYDGPFEIIQKLSAVSYRL